MKQLSLFDTDKETVKITKPIRLIEFFAGYGSQAMAIYGNEKTGSKL